MKFGMGLGLSGQASGVVVDQTPSAPTNTALPAITGTPKVGSTITVSNGTWTGFPAPTFTYQWRNSGSNISGATSASYTLVAGDDGDAIDCVVTATNDEGAASAASNSITAGYAPANTALPAITGTAEVGETLTTSNGTWTGAATIAFTYQWRRDGVNISGETANTYDLVAADDETDVDCVVTGSNAFGTETVNSVDRAVTYPVPSSTAAPVVSGTGEVGQTLSTTNGGWDNLPTSYTYQWRRDASNISGATSSTYTLVAGDDEADIDCVVTALNSGGSANADSNDIAVTYPAPTNSAVPVASGTGKIGDDLTTSNGTWTNSPTITYQWRRDGTNISGATSSTYTLIGADDGADIDCNVTATNSGGNASVNTNDIAVTYNAPVNSVAPVASGTGNVGQELSVTNGTWSNSPSFAYQWRRDGVAISGATSATYTLVEADDTADVDCVITATNSGGSASTDSNDISITAVSLNTVGGVKITIPISSGWFRFPDFSIIVDGSDDDIIDNMTRGGHASTSTGFSDFSLGEYGTTSSYDTNDTVWSAASWDEDQSPNTAGGHWNSRSGGTMVVYVKFDTPREVNKIKIQFNSWQGGTTGQSSFEDDEGNTMTPTSYSGPAISATGVFQSAGTAEIQF